MPLDLAKIGAQSRSYSHAYDWRKQAVYALGIGARRDELDYLYEGVQGGMKVFPTYAVVPAFEPLMELLIAAKTDLPMVVHGAQKIEAHRAIPSEGTIETVGTLRGIYDLKKFAQLVIHTKSTLGGEPLFDTEWSIIVRGAGGFGGERPPGDDEAPRAPKDTPPTFTVEEATSPEQALLYRVSGDTNPLHADPQFAANVGFADGPILHGLATFGFVGRAVAKKAAGGDATRVRVLGAQFRKPVWPGDVIVTSGWDLGGGKIALTAHAKGRPDPVVTNAWAEIR
jgi:acyl dehydratase